ncbi:MAG: RsbRD N-terminal domain-containing protein [Thermodesulfobacteriota bacterium]|nr:RsbRD N-terminal domain-containing protein [Thermodesulfobacteriota bacterium]
MRLNNLLERNKDDIVKQWLFSVIDTYPADTSKFMKGQKDPFANPVGNTISVNLGPLFDELLNEMDYESITSYLYPILRIRAVQPILSTSQSTGFIFLLKKVIRESLKKELSDKDILKELLHFESKIDELTLIAFDVYLKCREKVFEIKANEERNRTFRAFERAGLLTEIPADRPSL